jgi:hypothetical protein
VAQNVIDSLILKTQADIDFVKAEIFKNEKESLIYRGSRDGFEASDFHQKCDEIQNTITLI